MQFNKEVDGTYTELKQKNVDTGMGLERVLTIFNGKTNVYDTELFISRRQFIAFKYRHRQSFRRNMKIIGQEIKTHRNGFLFKIVS